MKKILLDGKEVQSLVPESLPLLIHGVHGSGASLYTVCLAAKWFSQGYSILFLCGYPMAEEAFTNEVGSEHANARFYTQKKVDEFIEAVKQNGQDQTIVVVKNIELFDDKVFETISNSSNLIISGDVSKSVVKDKILQKKFTTEVYFSALNGKEVPPLEKYHGFVTSGIYKGTTNLK